LIDSYWLKALLKALVLPPTGPLLVAAIGLGVLRRAPRAGRLLAFVGILSLLVLSVPAVSDVLRQSVGDSAPLDLSRAKSAQAIVILGGGRRRDATEYGGDTLGSLTLERVRYGARVARLTNLPVLVSGGAVLGGVPEAALMRQSLESEFGVGVRWAEDGSRDTHENAVRSAMILRAEGIDRVVLVTHDFDMRRARAEFAAAGIESIPAPTGMTTPGASGWLDYVPSIAGLMGSYYATYEILANAVRAITATR
jgi:uncharacterized SAM-binding protein YcdF (DUF218 family)